MRRHNAMRCLIFFLISLNLSFAVKISADEPPVINPFGPAPTEREDAVPGYVELSDGKICAGQIFLTRDARLKINDEKMQTAAGSAAYGRQADRLHGQEGMDGKGVEVQGTHEGRKNVHRPLVSQPGIRAYHHARRRSHDHRRAIGHRLCASRQPTRPPSRASIRPQVKTEKFLLNKRNKGEIGQDLKSLVYVKSIKLGKEAYDEGLKKIAESTKKEITNRKERKDHKNKK